MEEAERVESLYARGQDRGRDRRLARHWVYDREWLCRCGCCENLVLTSDYASRQGSKQVFRPNEYRSSRQEAYYRPADSDE